MDPALAPSPPKECSHSTCHKIIPGTEAGIKQYKTCEDCRARDAATRKRKRQEAKVTAQATILASKEAPTNAPTTIPAEGGLKGQKRRRISVPAVMPDGSGDEHESSLATAYKNYKDRQSLFQAVRACFNSGEDVTFYGYYTITEDPLVSDKERVEMTVNEVWKVTGYRFTVKDHTRLQQGHRTRLWCSQDQSQKKKEKPKPGLDVKHRENVGMTRYECNSKLVVSCAARSPTTRTRTVTVQLHHHKNHQLYHDVTSPPQAAALIRTSRERFTDTITTIREFCDGLEYQLQFGDQRMLETIEREGASFLPLAKACLMQERQMNTTRESPTTWGEGTSNTMWYRARPRRADINT